MYSSTEAAYDAAEREWAAMTEAERADVESAEQDAAEYERYERERCTPTAEEAAAEAAYYAALTEQAERAQAAHIAAEWDSAEQEQRARFYDAAVAAIEGGNGITIRNGNLTTVASMVGGVAQMEAFNASGQSVGATPFANTVDLLAACRIIATLSAWQLLGGEDYLNPAADPACPMCHGTGVVYDTVDYGSTTTQLPSVCECVTGDDDDADVAAWEPVIDYEPRRVGW